jgi:iron complex outermembrane recepter protein
MKSALSNRSIAAWKPLALASSLTVLASSAIAQTDAEQKLAPVTVSASRFESTEAPIGATVITAEQIREAGVGNVNEAIRKIGGVFGRQNFSGTSDYSLDLRGFGTNSDQNVAIFVDGIRISENELQPAMMSAIPIESVERIEIVRGGSSVLYGDGATGGTIQIITKRGASNGTRGSIVTEAGNRGYEEVRASASKGWDGFSLDANIGSLRTNNYRDNNDLKQDNFSGGLQWADQNTRVGMRVDVAREDVHFPGALTLSQYEQNPRQSLFPNDKGTLDSDRYTIFAEHREGNIQFAAELSQRYKTSDSSFGTGFDLFKSRADSEALQFSPRVKFLSGSTTVNNELVFGIDFQDANRTTKSRIFDGTQVADADGSQQSTAAYLRDEIRFGKARIAAGVRHERFQQDFSDPLSFSLTNYAHNFSLNAWDLMASYDIASATSVFAKAGKSYRVANIDEYTFSPNNAPLQPQRSNDLELGASFGNAGRKLTARVFRHNLTDEIFYDPTIPNIYSFSGFGANANLDPTRRQGIEIEGTMSIAKNLSISAILQHVSAKFRDGPNEGKELVLVPKNTATLRLNWQPTRAQTADIGVQWVDKQRYGKDFSNSCDARIPSFATLDGRYAIRVGTWEFAVIGTNLTDKNYYAQAFGDCTDNRGIYPDAGRAIRLSARKDF